MIDVLDVVIAILDVAYHWLLPICMGEIATFYFNNSFPKYNGLGVVVGIVVFLLARLSTKGEE